MQCPFCKFDMPDGATTCGHCGAYEWMERKYVRTEYLIPIFVFLTLIGVFTVPALLGNGYPILAIGAGALIVGGWVAFYRWPKKAMWSRPTGTRY